jgi:hypothetical protein
MRPRLLLSRLRHRQAPNPRPRWVLLFIPQCSTRCYRRTRHRPRPVLQNQPARSAFFHSTRRRGAPRLRAAARPRVRYTRQRSVPASEYPSPSSSGRRWGLSRRWGRWWGRWDWAVCRVIRVMEWGRARGVCAVVIFPHLLHIYDVVLGRLFQARYD